jgi:hypothetical protein
MLIVVYAECHYAECHYAECHYAECHYAECRYAKCRGAKLDPFIFCPYFTADPNSLKPGKPN